MTKIIGLTGGIATGKSTVAKILATQGLPIVDADQVTRQVEAPGTPVLQALIKAFGPTMQQPDGGLNRAALGRLVFADTAALAQLNKITKLPIQYAIFQALVEHQTQPFVVLDVPLLFEAGWQHVCDQTVLVAVSPQQQLQRLMARNQLSVVAAKQRIAAQLPLATKKQQADVVIDNGGTIEATRVAVLQWLATLTAK